jgi:hypothetical protein
MIAGRYNDYTDYVWQNRHLFPDIYGEESEEEEEAVDWDYVSDMQRDDFMMREGKNEF